MATAKGEATRGRIIDAALKLFAEDGYEATTMRRIAAEAGASLGLAYRYFKRKDEIVLELFRRTIEGFEAALPALPAGTVAERVCAALEKNIALCDPYRAVFAAVVPMTLAPGAHAFALGDGAVDVRARVVRCYTRVVDDGSDVEGLPSVENVALLCFVLHLAVLFYWLHDTSDGRARTHALVGVVRDAFHLGLGALMLPDVDEGVRRVTALLLPLFGAGVGTGSAGPAAT